MEPPVSQPVHQDYVIRSTCLDICTISKTCMHEIREKRGRYRVRIPPVLAVALKVSSARPTRDQTYPYTDTHGVPRMASKPAATNPV